VRHGRWERYPALPAAGRGCIATPVEADQGRPADPFEGAGKPGPLRRDLSGFWSRRIDEHRLVYGATDDELIIIPGRYHYDG